MRRSLRRARGSQRKTLTKVGRIGLSIALVSAGLIFIHPLGAQGERARANKTKGTQVSGVPVQAVRSAVIDFRRLASRQPSRILALEGVPKVIPEPKEIDDRVNDGIRGEPAPNVPVDVPETQGPSPSPANNFAALDDIAQAGTGFFVIPPDTMGAVGTDSVNKVMVTLNNNYRIQNKTTGAQIGSDVSMPNFWAAVGANDPFDPRVQYDPYNDRWIVAAVSDAGTSTAAILVGVSATSDPSGSFFLFKVSARIAGDPAPVNFADFPMLGFNKNWVVVSINMFNNSSGAFSDGRSLVIDYPTLRTGSLSSTYFTGVSTANAGFCMHPATTYSATEGTEYLVAHLSSASATYRMHTITGTPAAPVFTLGTTKTRPGGGWAQPSGNILPQSLSGSAGTCATATITKMETADAYVRSNVVFRNSEIWYPQTIGLPAGGLTHTAAQWTQLNTSGDVLQGGRVEDPTATATNGGKWYAYPSIAVNSADDVLFGFSQFSSAQFASAGYTYRDHTDGAGTMRDPIVFKAGEDCYSKDFGSGRNRWGDYSHTMVEPTGDCSFWTIEEYAKLSASPTVGGSDSKWGTWWAKVDSHSCGVTTPTPTNTPTSTPSPTPTFTATPTLPALSPTFTPTPTQTQTLTPSPTLTPTPTQTATLTSSPTFTATQTPLPPTPTFTPTFTVTPTATFTQTLTPTPTITSTFTQTLTPTPTSTLTPSPTFTATQTPPPTFTPTFTITPTASPTPTFTQTFTHTLTVTPTSTQTFTPTPTQTATLTPSPTFTATPPQPTPTLTQTFTTTPTLTPTQTLTQTITPTPTRTPISGLNYYTLTPCRLVDTRNPNGPLGGPSLVAGATRTFVLAGQCGIPVTAKALSLNVVVVLPTTGPGHLTVYPVGASLPLSATINYNQGNIRANNSIMPLGASGDVAVFCGQGSGTVDLVIDTNGYFR